MPLYVPAAVPALMRFVLTGVNFNSATTDNTLSIVMPPNVTRWLLNRVQIANASASISTATCGMFTATGGGGVALAANQAITVTASAADTGNNAMLLTLSNTNITWFNDTTVYFRIGTAQGSAATADVIINIHPLT